MNRASSRRWPALGASAVAAIPMVLAACGAAQPVPTASPRGPTPNASVASTIAFSITIPRGWADVTGDPSVAGVRSSGQVLVTLQKPPQPPIEEGVNDVDSVIVVTELDQPLSAAQVVPYLQSVLRSGATDLTQPIPTTVGGSGGTSVTYVSTQETTPVETEDIVVARGGTMYEIELIASRHAFATDAHDLEQMLSHGWTWVRAD